jgi:hypothetical protein
MTEPYLEDFTVGQNFGSGRLRIDKEQITCNENGEAVQIFVGSLMVLSSGFSRHTSSGWIDRSAAVNLA